MAWRAGDVSFAAYFLTIVALGALLAFPPLARLWSEAHPWWLLVLTTLFVVIGLSQLALALVHRVASLFIAPAALPRMDFRAGIPVNARTLVVVPTLLGDESDAETLAEELEVRFLANRDPHLHFALLTDFPDWHEETRASDARVLDAACAAIETLNRRHAGEGGDIFYLLHRPRVWNEGQSAWIGFERKRGKLGDLNALIRGGSTERFSRIVGDPQPLRGVRYVITLDTDTRLPRDAARELVATMEHPLNRPRYREDGGLVVGGYGILQPRIGSTLPVEGVSSYAAIFGGDAGLDPYTRAVSDTYQDAFAEGSFIGKGIYDVDAFERILGDRFPDNRILSHDLLEGSYIRSGLATDVEFYERYPQSYLVDIARRYRWIRGDWQIAEWLFPTVPIAGGRREKNPLSALSRWKIFDNLRRSLVPVALTGLLVLGWFFLSGPLYWTLIVLEIVLLPALLDVALSLAQRSAETPFGQHLTSNARDAWRRFGQVVFSAACLPFEAWLSLDAIARTWWRVHVSRRRLLQWVASGTIERRVRHRLVGAVFVMWTAPLMALAMGAALLYLHANFAVAAPWLVLWLIAPLLAWWLSRVPDDSAQALDARQVAFVRNVARRTWAFFERFVGEEDHWLPPDNYQEQPIAKVAHRTSPTNIGLSLLANLAARDFGYVTLGELLARCSHTMQTLQGLARYRGHFYNWYDTTTLQPLYPLYVSTVDSGNLIAHLLTLRQGLLELIEAPLPTHATLAGIADTFAVLQDSTPTAHADRLNAFAAALKTAMAGDEAIGPHAMITTLRSLAQHAEAVHAEFMAIDDELASEWAGKLKRQCAAHLAEWIELLPDATSPITGEG
ncbi:MAG: cyclic beta 1-2 glucan synthetase, partial [Rhodanobacteraceae bacterium]